MYKKFESFFFSLLEREPLKNSKTILGTGRQQFKQSASRIILYKPFFLCIFFFIAYKVFRVDGLRRSTESSRGRRGETTEYIAKKKKRNERLDLLFHNRELLFLFSFFFFSLKEKQTGSLKSQAEKAKW